MSPSPPATGPAGLVDPAFAPLSPEQRAHTHERFERARRLMASPQADPSEVGAMLLAVVLADPGNAVYVQAMADHFRQTRAGGGLAAWLDVFRGKDKSGEQALAARQWGRVVQEGLPRLAKDPRNVRLVRAVAQGCIGAGAFGAGLVWLRYALDLQPQDADLQRQIARLLGSMGRFDQAIEVWRRVVERLGSDDEAAEMITRLSFEKKHGRKQAAQLLPQGTKAPGSDQLVGLLKSGARQRRISRGADAADLPPGGDGPSVPSPLASPRHGGSNDRVSGEPEHSAPEPASAKSVESGESSGPSGSRNRSGWSTSDTGEMSRQVLDALAAATPDLDTDERDPPLIRESVDNTASARPVTLSALEQAKLRVQAAAEAGHRGWTESPEGPVVMGLPQDRDPGPKKRKVELTPRQELEDRLRDEPRIPELYVELSALWEAEGNLDQAMRSVQRGLSICGPDLTLIERGEEIRLRQAERQLALAIRHAEVDKSRVAKDLVTDLRTTLNRVEIEVISARRDRHPDQPFWTLELAVRQKRGRNFEAALALLESLPGDGPLAGRTALERGETEQHLTQFEAAVTSYQRAVAVTPPDSELNCLASYRLGVLLAALSRYNEARSVLSDLLSRRKDYRDVATRLDNLPSDDHNV